MTTVLNARSRGKVVSIEDWREATAKTWDRLGRAAQPDHLHLADRQIAEEFRAGRYDPPAMKVRKFNLCSGRYED